MAYAPAPLRVDNDKAVIHMPTVRLGLSDDSRPVDMALAFIGGLLGDHVADGEAD